MGTANISSTSPYIQYSVTPDFQYSTVDFTNPEAADWYAQVQHQIPLTLCPVPLSCPRQS